ncbi:MAG: hypothetical protein KA313_01820 [Pseudarcicella sp.]|nr:hypothetical protein [Pseudarcicella sp.]MBP6409815.1 hypothetical protein [Pseudarcicella sp.]
MKPKPRPPRKKLSMPYFGSIMPSHKTSSVDDTVLQNQGITKKLINILVLLGLFIFVFQYVKSTYFKEGYFENSQEIYEMAIDGKIIAKYSEEVKEKRFFVIEIKDKNKKSYLLSLKNDQSDASEKLFPKMKIVKEKDTFEIKIYYISNQNGANIELEKKHLLVLE